MSFRPLERVVLFQAFLGVKTGHNSDPGTSLSGSGLGHLAACRTGGGLPADTHYNGQFYHLGVLVILLPPSPRRLSFASNASPMLRWHNFSGAVHA